MNIDEAQQIIDKIARFENVKPDATDLQKNVIHDFTQLYSYDDLAEKYNMPKNSIRYIIKTRIDLDNKTVLKARNMLIKNSKMPSIEFLVNEWIEKNPPGSNIFDLVDQWDLSVKETMATFGQRLKNYNFTRSEQPVDTVYSFDQIQAGLDRFKQDYAGKKFTVKNYTDWQKNNSEYAKVETIIKRYGSWSNALNNKPISKGDTVYDPEDSKQREALELVKEFLNYQIDNEKYLFSVLVFQKWVNDLNKNLSLGTVLTRLNRSWIGVKQLACEQGL